MIEPQSAEMMTAGIVIARLLPRPDAMPPEFASGGVSESVKDSRLGEAGSAQMLDELTSPNDLKAPATTT